MKREDEEKAKFMVRARTVIPVFPAFGKVAYRDWLVFRAKQRVSDRMITPDMPR